jgi:hypothetical protein
MAEGPKIGAQAFCLLIGEDKAADLGYLAEKRHDGGPPVMSIIVFSEEARFSSQPANEPSRTGNLRDSFPLSWKEYWAANTRIICANDHINIRVIEEQIIVSVPHPH